MEVCKMALFENLINYAQSNPALGIGALGAANLPGLVSKNPKLGQLFGGVLGTGLGGAMGLGPAGIAMSGLGMGAFGSLLDVLTRPSAKEIADESNYLNYIKAYNPNIPYPNPDGIAAGAVSNPAYSLNSK